MSCLFTSCGSESNTSNTSQDGSNSNSTVFESDTSNTSQDGSDSSSTITDSENGIIPLYTQDKIMNNISSYSHSFKITAYDKICSYEIKFDYETSTGLARIQNYNSNNEKIDDPIDYFFIKDINNDCAIYSYNSEYYSHTFSKDKADELYYLRLLFDLSSEINENAPYESKTELTYAGRQATKYVISDPEYIISAETNLYITLDNETGAVLSVTEEDFNYYESYEFTPNNEQAKNEVIAKKNTIPFDYFDTKILNIVNLENIVFPDEKFLINSNVVYKDGSSTNLSNLSSYNVGYHYYKEDTTFITDLCHYIYNQGIKYDDKGNVFDFDEVCTDETVDWGYTQVRIISFFSYINVNDVNYYVKLQAQKPSYSINFWYVWLEIRVD